MAQDDAAALSGRLQAEGRPGPAPEAGARPWVPGSLDEFFFREDEPGSPVLDHGLAAAEHLEPTAPLEPRQEYLGFFLGEEEYALEIASVREILREPVITEVPRGPRDVLGVITVRGVVMPVIDPRRRLALPARPAGGGHRVVVCQHRGPPVAVLVDRVSQVVRLPPSAIEARPQGIGGAEPGTIAGIGRERDRLYIILDPAALLGAGAGREQLA
jgi:purine-binding chemotaxis protein CheW